VNYIAGGYQTQLGAETHIVAAICESFGLRMHPNLRSDELTMKSCKS